MAAHLTPLEAETILNASELAIDVFDCGRVLTTATLARDPAWLATQPVDATLNVIEDYMRRLDSLRRQAEEAVRLLRDLH